MSTPPLERTRNGYASEFTPGCDGGAVVDLSPQPPARNSACLARPAGPPGMSTRYQQSGQQRGFADRVARRQARKIQRRLAGLCSDFSRLSFHAAFKVAFVSLLPQIVRGQPKLDLQLVKQYFRGQLCVR